MREYDPNTMTVKSCGPTGVVCALCDEPFVYDDGCDEAFELTMAELDTACQRHWRQVHEHPNATPM